MNAARSACLWLLAACATGPDDGREVRGPALLVHHGDTTAIQLPSSTRVGEPIVLRFGTFLTGCIREGPIEVTLTDQAVEVRPTRIELVDLPRDFGCPDVLRSVQHVVPLQFSAPGTVRLRLVGWARPGERPFVVERDIEVTP